MKLLLFPNFWTFSAFRSIALFCKGIAGSIGLCSGAGLATLVIGTDCVPCLRGKSLGFPCACLRLGVFCGKGLKATALWLSMPWNFWRFSIWPSTVVPLKARSWSGTPVNFMTPRAGATPKPSARKAWSSAALRLFVVGRSWEGRALIVRM